MGDHPRLQAGLRWLLGALFLWAAISKLANPTDFLGAVYGYELPLPRSILRFAAVVLPWIELLCALLLISGSRTASALVIAAVMIGLFLVASGQAWARGLTISCGCFDLRLLGIPDGAPRLSRLLESPGFAFARNLVLAGITIFLLRQTADPSFAVPAPMHPPTRSPSAPRPAPEGRNEGRRQGHRRRR